MELNKLQQVKKLSDMQFLHDKAIVRSNLRNLEADLEAEHLSGITVQLTKQDAQKSKDLISKLNSLRKTSNDLLRQGAIMTGRLPQPAQ